METIFCLINSGYGVYIPKAFVECYNFTAWNIKPEDADVLLQGPDAEFYWETWEDVLNYAHHIKDGRKFVLWANEDLFCYDLENHVFED